jgi:outer membrane lipoprotein-sorting protein
MSDDQTDNPDIRLEQLIDALRDQPVPAGPDAEVRERVLEALASAEDDRRSTVRPTAERNRIMRRVLGLAASVLVVAAVVGWIVSKSDSPAGSAFAQMLQQVTSARTATFVTRVTPTGKDDVVAHTTLMEPGWMRQQVTSDNMEAVQVMNMQQGKMLVLFPKLKQAQLLSMEGLPDENKHVNIIDEFRKLDPAKAKLLGREEIGGRETLKYQCDNPTGYYVVWLDAQDKLPVKVTMSAAPDDEDGFGTIILTDFEWNVPVDESQFTFAVPEGYEFDLHTLDLANTTDKDFITMLRFYVRLNNDTFPDQLNPFTIAFMGKLFEKPGASPEEKRAYARQRIAYAYDRPELANMTDEEHKRRAPELGMPLARGAIYLAQVQETNEWHYFGKGVKLGEADRIVAWWTPKKQGGDKNESDQSAEARTATVLYADLHIETRPVEGLPTEL